MIPEALIIDALARGLDDTSIKACSKLSCSEHPCRQIDESGCSSADVEANCLLQLLVSDMAETALLFG